MSPAVGANGSGKSNFFAAIQFVLDTSSTVLRAEDRKLLLHEGAGAHVLTAFVEITLDNSERRMPIDKDEVVIRRTIGLKKDEYFIERKHCSKNELIALLETSGISRANPYNIVPQGKVNALVMMKDAGRLEMLKDIGGVNTYDERRTESMKMMNDTRDKQGKVNETLKYIGTRLHGLEEEKEELVQAQTLDKKRKVMEYTYYDKELKKSKSELDQMEAQRSETSKGAAESSKQEESLLLSTKEAEKKLKETKAQLARAQTDWQARAAEHKSLLEVVARLEQQVKQAGLDAARRDESREVASKELNEIEEQVAEVEARLEAGRLETTSKRAEAERCGEEVERAEAALRHLHAKEGRTSQFKTRQERDKHLEQEAKELRASLKKKDAQADMLRSDLDNTSVRIGEAEQAAADARQRLTEKRAEAAAAREKCVEFGRQRDTATDERKALWRKEQELVEARRTASDDLDKAHRTLQHSMSRQQWEAICAVRKIAKDKKIKGLHGLVVELFTVDEKFNTAIEVTAGNQLFQMVVDNDEIASVLLKELQKANAGRVTFMPLNRLKSGADPAYPDSAEAIPMLSRLSFKPQFRPALAEIFRKGLIVRTLEVGTRFAKSHGLDCVTIAGDQVNRKGAMTGGYLEARRSRIGAQADILRLAAEVAAFDDQQTEVTASLVTVDQKVTTLLGELQRHELAAQKALAAAELVLIDLPAATAATAGNSRASKAHKAADAQKERAHAALLAAAQSERERLTAVQAEMESDFSSKLSAAERTEVQSLHARLQGLHKTRDAAGSDASKAESIAAGLRDQLDEHLRKRQEELRETVATLAPEMAGANVDEGVDEDRLAEERTKLATAEQALDAAAEERTSKRETERSLQATTEGLKTRVTAERARQAEEAKQIDRLLSRRGLLQQRAEEFAACIRKLGAIPKDALDGVHGGLSSKVLLAEIEKCLKEIAKLGHVNKKALDQYASFSEERDRLITKQDEMDAARESIDELIEHLDHKKYEAIERTFKGVSLQFAIAFAELVSGGSGKLIMTQHSTLPPGTDAAARVANYAGVAIKVQFPGGGVATSMAQLSGGQKTMVALCLIFAIQRCDPAPFYIFDEIDAALDATHRSALAAIIEQQAAEVDDKGEERTPTQFVTTTFRPELIKAADKCYGVTHVRKASTIKNIDQAEAQRIIAEDQNRQRQHIGVSR